MGGGDDMPTDGGTPQPAPHQRRPIQPRLTPEELRFYRSMALWLVGALLAVAAGALLFGRREAALLTAVVAVLAYLLVRAQMRFFAFQYAYFLRIPVLLYLLTIAMPVLAVYPGREFFGNMLVLGTRQALWVGVALGMVISAQATTARLLLRASGSRSGLPIERGKPIHAQAGFDFGTGGWVVLMAVPLLVWGGILVGHAPGAYLRVGAAFATAMVVVYLAFWRLLLFVGVACKPYFGPGARLGGFWRWMGAGYADHAASHFALAVSTGISFLLYLAGWHALQPPAPVFPSFPAIAFVLVLLLVVSWTLPALSFLLDKYRLPLTLVVAPVWLILQTLGGPDHYYALRAGPPPAAMPPVASVVLRERLRQSAQPSGARPLVAVVASGGGITASLWTGSVLAYLQSDPALGDEMARDIALVSTVSGGSVGAMFYVDAYREGRPPANVWAVADAAGTSSLDATAWGMVYPDFVRSVTGFFPVDHLEGRAWANEQVWGKAGASSTLAGWAAGVAAQWRPLHVLNATEVETGASVQLSAARLDGKDGLLDPLCCDPNVGACPPRSSDQAVHWAPTVHDMAVTTAARLSATFPFVTPVSRGLPPSGKPCGYHLADGGYFDNYGVHAAVDLLDRALEADRQTQRVLPGQTPWPRPRLLVLQIEAFPPDPAAKTIPGWEGTTIGPLVTLLGTLTSQADRNRTELQLFVDKWSWYAEIERFHFVLAPKQWPTPRQRSHSPGCLPSALREQCATLEPPGGEPPRAQELPTSWQLSCAEKRTVVCHWQRDATTQDELRRLRAAYAAARHGP